MSTHAPRTSSPPPVPAAARTSRPRAAAAKAVKAAAGDGACSACKEAQRPDDPPLRRGRCVKCYERWVRKKPVGLGATCASCHERRKANLRQFELHKSWVVLCHNCAARADALTPPPRSVEGLVMKLSRERRWGDRRAEAVGREPGFPGSDRRDGDRRQPTERNAIDATALCIEMEAESADSWGEFDVTDLGDGPITGIHRRVDLEELEGEPARRSARGGVEE